MSYCRCDQPHIISFFFFFFFFQTEGKMMMSRCRLQVSKGNTVYVPVGRAGQGRAGQKKEKKTKYNLESVAGQGIEIGEVDSGNVGNTKGMAE